jgi:hypothetical protein
MKSAIPILLLLFICVSASHGQEQNHDPDKAQLVMSDIPLFWHVYDSSTPETLAQNLQKEYVEKGSQGVQDFIPYRIQNGENLAKQILSHRDYYESIRASSMKVLTMESEFRVMFRKLNQIYPNAVFPPVYFVIGARNSGGTSSDHGLIVGAEMFAESGSRLHFADLTAVVIHELIHFQQKGSGSDLLPQLMREGAADFIAETIVGRESDDTLKDYGDAHEQVLWDRLQKDLSEKDQKAVRNNWLYNGGLKENAHDAEPPDLGYYMGYKIAQSYLQCHTDKKRALITITEMADPKMILEQSCYAQRFH